MLYKVSRYIFLYTTLIALYIQTVRGCSSLKFKGSSNVCVCNVTYCDQFVFDYPTDDKLVLIETSESDNGNVKKDKNKGFWENLKNFTVSETLKENNIEVVVNLNEKLQRIVGFGGALTDATAINFNISESQNLTDFMLESYFGNTGIHYNTIRVPIAGSDFSTRPYSYDDDVKNDWNLTHWALAPEDLDLKIPFIHKIKDIVAKNSRTLKLFASPWAPPCWMKDNAKINKGHLKNDSTTYQAYANYLVKFFQAYKEHNIDFWGATIQNEPISSFMPFYFFNSLQFTKAEQQNFLINYYGPTLEAHGFNKQNFKLMAGDDSLGFLNYLVPGLFDNPQVSRYVSALAFHWYTSDLLIPYSSLKSIYLKVKDKIEFMLMTEACTGSMPVGKGPKLGDWKRGEMYAKDIIEDLKRFTSGWIDWNMALDLQGGPNWSRNFVDAPIIVDKEKLVFYKQPMFYAMGHFSRFLSPNDTVVDTQVSSSSSDIRAIAATKDTTTNHLVAVLLNTSSKNKTIKLKLINTDLEKFYTFDIEAKSIATAVVKL